MSSRLAERPFSPDINVVCIHWPKADDTQGRLHFTKGGSNIYGEMYAYSLTLF
jgi:hypothetical protein